MKNNDNRSFVAIIMAASVGGALLMALAFTLGPWTPEPQETVALELLGLIAAGLGALSVYIGMSVTTDSSSRSLSESDEDIMRDWGGPDDESDPELEAEELELEAKDKDS